MPTLRVAAQGREVCSPDQRRRGIATYNAPMPEAATEIAAEPALFVDLDGTLLRGDLLWESLSSSVRFNPLAAIRGIGNLAEGRAALKHSLARSSSIDVTVLPYRASFLDWIRSEWPGIHIRNNPREHLVVPTLGPLRAPPTIADKCKGEGGLGALRGHDVPG